MWLYEMDILHRLLELRRRGRVGIILADLGHYSISNDVFDPHGGAIRYTLSELASLVIRLEAEEKERKGPGREELGVQDAKRSRVVSV